MMRRPVTPSEGSLAHGEQTPAPAMAVLPPASYRRLQEIKAASDPDRVIISAHPVWPARP